jgi:hypothetical protein
LAIGLGIYAGSLQIIETEACKGREPGPLTATTEA